ncbi:hypothetical protein D6851_04690 [Altericroceibacterium spongiae]|uniref:EF-hand domain-containing protein n=1 Tax=Altericroceibacterium spongiae TaxID=2320269 RepID=A0A420EPC5_9SPHN|nr:EF-hand domain-containing protein [Altericroceibacterium spongiae]RKF22522.1 hypothetical protein D6851_04690 [Altericroceibacterium spongiae]
MRKLTLSIAAATVALAGGATLAFAQPKGGGDFTREQAQERASSMFDRMDANGDGVLDDADREAREKQRFERLDTDGDGSISPEEFAARKQAGKRGSGMGRRGHHGMRHGGPGGSGPMFMMADANKDGTVTRAEFDAQALSMFSRMDTNGDGTVTADERKAARDAMRAKFREARKAQTSNK